MFKRFGDENPEDARICIVEFADSDDDWPQILSFNDDGENVYWEDERGRTTVINDDDKWMYCPSSADS